MIWYMAIEMLGLPMSIFFENVLKTKTIIDFKMVKNKKMCLNFILI